MVGSKGEGEVGGTGQQRKGLLPPYLAVDLSSFIVVRLH